MTRKKGIAETPIVFRVTEKDFDTFEDWKKYCLYQEWLTENNKRSEFNRQASIEKTFRFLNGEEEKWKQLDRIVKEKGIDQVLNDLINPPIKSNDIDLDDLANKLVEKLQHSKVINIGSVGSTIDESTKEVPKDIVNNLLNLS